MKKTRLVLGIILLVLAVALALLILHIWQTEPQPIQEPALQETAPQEPAEPEPTPEEVWAAGADETTEPLPEPEPLPAGETVILNGKTLETVEQAGADYARADEIAAALGLEFSGDSTAAIFSGETAAQFYALDNYVQWDEQGFELQNSPITYEEYLYLPVQQLARKLNYGFYRDSETDQLYVTPAAGDWETVPDINVPVLMYHAVSDNMWGIPELFVSPSDMDAQLQYLVDNGYDPIWFEDLANLEDYDKPVILTFDDGYDDNYNELLPLLQKHNVKATVFVIGNAMGMQHKMTEEQVREMADSGLVSIQSHGLTHHNMDAMGETEMHEELAESQRILTAVTGRVPYVVCYPSGRYSNITLAAGPDYYKFGLKMNGGLYNTSDDPFLVNRYYVSRYTSLDSFASMLTEAGT